MTNMRQLSVQLGERTYPIYIGKDLLDELPNWLAGRFNGTRHVVLVSDEKVLSTIARTLSSALSARQYRVSEITVPSGEASKCVEQIARLWHELLAERTDRSSIVIAVGGGVVGDLAGFAAATFARGIPLVQVPTTLLSQVDSSVGGKTGINLPAAKNIVGSFWQPSLVAIDVASLRTLPQREFVSGLAEVVKCGMILLPDLFEFLEANVPQILALDEGSLIEIIARSCQAKASVVEQDERETTGLRAILNYGHTFAHALESAQGYGTLLHGEAVSIGMHLAAQLAHRMGRIPQELVVRQCRLLEILLLPTRIPLVDPEHLWQLMQHDKKVAQGNLRFILPNRLGHVELVSGVDKRMVIDVLSNAR